MSLGSDARPIYRARNLTRAFDDAVERFAPAGMRVTGGREEPRLLGRIGPLEVRLARSAAEVRLAQQLRYRVFYEEMDAEPTRLQRLSRRDRDAFDRHCDHLLVLDRLREGSDQVVGTYRLMRASGAARAGGFYAEGEFDVGAMIARHPGRRFLELGRSCVLPQYRGKRTVELLWQGIWAFVLEHRIDALFGCASLAGTDLAKLAPVLSFLSQEAAAPDEWLVRALPHRGSWSGEDEVRRPDRRLAIAALPPLLKGYLRLGGYVGDGAVVDRQFGTTDVLIVLPRERINPRYIGHYGADAGRFAA